jgi:endonuclease YncB( thermonuclease family)
VETLVRIRGIDTPERHGGCAREIAAASMATAALGQLVGTAPVVLSRIAGDKYFGRVLADVTSASGVELASAMLAGGFARPYDGRARSGWCEESAKSAETVLGTIR